MMRFPSSDLEAVMRISSLVSRRMLFVWCGLVLVLGVVLLGEIGCNSAPLGITTYGGASHPTPDLARPEPVYLSAPAPDCSPVVPCCGPERICGGVMLPAIPAVIAPEQRVAGSTPTAPQVWKRDRRRPTVARVYVGDGNSLELVSVHVTVTVDGPRARTLVDHVFRNTHDHQLEGTFEYPLPSGASPSYFAMFAGQAHTTPPPLFARHGSAPSIPEDALASMKPSEVAKHVSTIDWGKLQEARVVSREKALEVYEETTRAKIDPALLEYAGGNTFSGRVFPIAAKGYSRVMFAYEELLPATDDSVQYRFALPTGKLKNLQFTLQTDEACSRNAVFQPDDGECARKGKSVSYSRSWKGKGPGGEAIFAFRAPTAGIQAVSGRQGENGPYYLYTRIRPDVKTQQAKPFADRAVFLLDTSLSEHPDRFAVSMKLMHKVLESDPDIKHFNILTFDSAARWVAPNGWLDNTSAGREKLFAQLDGILLEGATDLSAALDALAKPPFEETPTAPVNVFLLSDGQLTWGDTNAGQLAAKFEAQCPFSTRFQCYRFGLGADNLELFEALTRRGGGIVQCYGEPGIAAAAQAHRHQCLQIDSVRFSGGPAVSDVMVAGRQAAVYPGGELIIAGRSNDPGRTTLVVEGTFLGQKVVKEYPVEIGSANELAPRGWAEIAVASLLALDSPKLDTLATAYCQQFGIASRVASLLVLENESDYKRLNLEEERGKTAAGDLGAFLDNLWKDAGKVLSSRESFERFLEQIQARVKLFDGADGKHVKKLLAALSDADFELPPQAGGGAIWKRKDVPAEYMDARKHDPRNVATYVAEAKRRAGEQDVDGAVRVLSSIVEQYPGRSDALRLTGYRLLTLDQPIPAARLFRQVERQRPFEAHSYRDLARGLEESGLFGLAAMQYEIVLAGSWDSRFHDSLKTVAREEYVQMMQTALRKKGVSPQLANVFGERLEGLAGSQKPSDLRVTMSWNTDATDVDLWVIEPDGEKCFYQNTHTKSGGELSQDQTQGYGPERYQIPKAKQGVYTIITHYFRPNPILLGGETHVNVVITRYAGTPRETSERHTVILKKHDDQVEVAKVKF
jgi:hypothetical protein